MTRLIVLVALVLSRVWTPCFFVASFSPTLLPVARTDVWTASKFLNRQGCATNDDEMIAGRPIDSRGGEDIRGSNNRSVLESMEVVDDEINVLNNTTTTTTTTTSSSTRDSAAATAVPQWLPAAAAEMFQALVSIKEKVYAIVRRAVFDLVTIVRRSATKARDWAVDDEVGQLVSSSLALIAFFGGVAAFAAWNIQVLSGGKSQWSAPKVTAPVIRGLPEPSSITTKDGRGTIESPAVIRFQKPKWKGPEFRTSYISDESKRATEGETENAGSKPQ